jgi:hypothetical protein
MPKKAASESSADRQKTLFSLDGMDFAASDGQGLRRPYMKLSTGKIVLGTALAISVGAFTFPAGASIPTTAQNKSVARKTVGVQLAQVDEKVDEMHDAAHGAKNAVVAAHRRHERNEYRHRTIGSKIDSKIGEVKSEAKGAGHAIERAHENHEAVERAEGRD